MEVKFMKKALLFSILFFFLCANLAFATAEQTVDVQFQGKVATVTDGILDATITLGTADYLSEPFIDEEIGILAAAILTITIYKEDDIIYDKKQFPCTIYLDPEGSGKVTSKSDLIGEISNFNSEGPPILPAMVVQIPGDGITGILTGVPPAP